MLKNKTKRSKKSNKKSSLGKLAKHLFVPHKGNKYHPHIIRWQAIALTAAVSLTTHIAYGYFTTGQLAVLGKTVTISTTELEDLTNKARAQSNLPALELNNQLSEAAVKKGEDMIANNYWSHNSPKGLSPWHWIEQSGYSYAIAGENLAKNYPDASSVMNAWMSSSTHRDNILNPKYTSVGFAVVEGVIDMKINTIVVAYYAAPTEATAAVKGDSINLTDQNLTSFNNPLVYVGTVIKGMNPITIGVLAGMTVMIVVASLAHLSRHYLPVKVRNTWRRHHGLYKAIGITVAATILIIISAGQTI